MYNPNLNRWRANLMANNKAYRVRDENLRKIFYAFDQMRDLRALQYIRKIGFHAGRIFFTHGPAPANQYNTYFDAANFKEQLQRFLRANPEFIDAEALDIIYMRRNRDRPLNPTIMCGGCGQQKESKRAIAVDGQDGETRFYCNEQCLISSLQFRG